MATTFSSDIASTVATVSRAEKQPLYRVRKIDSVRYTNVAGVSLTKIAAVAGRSTNSTSLTPIKIGPSYEVEISDEGKVLAKNKK